MARFELLTQCASRGGTGGASDHSATQWVDDISSFTWSESTPIGDNRLEIPTFSATDFWELGRVEACHWFYSFPLMFTYIICNKKLRFYCDFCHQKVLKKNCQHFLVNKKHGWRFLYNLDEVQNPFLTFFSYNGGYFLLISLVKPSP